MTPTKLIQWLFGSPPITRGCNESGDKDKDPRGCWNVRCQLGRVCCRPVDETKREGA